MNVWKRVCLHRWRDHHSLLQANTNCQSFDWQAFCWTGEAAHEQKLYFHSELQTQTTELVQYMSILFMKQIKCHSCEWTLFLQSPGTVTVGLCCLKLTYLQNKKGMNLHTIDLQPPATFTTLHLSIFITLSSFQNLPSFRLHLYPACSCAFFGLDGPGGTYCMLSGRLLVHPGRKWRVGVGRTGNGMGVDSLLTHFSPEELHLGDRCQVISDTSFPLYTRTLSDRHKQGRTQLQLIAGV